MTAFYNEIDRYCAQWLRNLIEAGHIAPGIVDERSIEDITPNELRGFTQCHFFAGIGVWSYALRLSGWPDDRPVWTGSCPCQPFSQAGKGAGFADERHLWPAWFHLIRECRPDVVFGEQVASPDGLAWLDLVQADLEGAGYASAAVDLCAAGVGAPHIRQRIKFVADSYHDGCETRREGCATVGYRATAESDCGARLMGDTDDARLEGRVVSAERSGECATWPAGMAGATRGFWRDAEWIGMRDGRLRPIEPGSFPLASRPAARVGRLRAYGNAIVAPAAAAFIRAYLESRMTEAA